MCLILSMMIDREFPNLLFKYLDACGGLKMLENETLKFTLINNLNDPYDCFHMKPLELRTQHNNSPVVVTGMEEAYNYIFSNSVGICSLCENPLNYLMWSYYNQHKGVCLAIDMEVVNEQILESTPYEELFFSLKKVNYTENVPLLDIDEVINDEEDDWKRFIRAQTELHNFLSSKSNYWNHEQEYRLIMRKSPSYDENHDHFEKIAHCITAIYLGFNIAPEKARQYIEFARNKNINIYHVYPDEKKFGFKATEISKDVSVETLFEA